MMAATPQAANRWQFNSTFFLNLTAGLAISVIQIIMALSLASLMFSGPLAVDLPRAIGLTLITTVIHLLIGTFFSGFKGIILNVQDNPAVIITVAISTLISTLGSSPALLPTVIALIMVTTLLAGGFLVLLGRLKLGGLVRYIPYPVIGGFLAGSGWLMSQGAFGTMAGYRLTLPNLPHLLTAEEAILWVPGVIFAVVLFVGLRRLHSPFTMPGIMGAALVVFYLVLLVTGTSIDAATQRGMLLGDVGSTAIWSPLPLAEITQADWGAVLGQVGSIGAVLALTGITLLLNVSGLELVLRHDIDLNRELQVTGVANLVSALAGGMIGYHSVAQTSLRHRIGAEGRLPGLIIAGMCLFIIAGGSAVLAYMPRFMLGGLLLLLGLNFLYEWIIQGRKKLGRTDYLVVLFILVIIASSGFLAGVAVGLVLMVVLFVISYSRLNLFHSVTTGSEVVSHVQRTVYHQRALTDLGKQTYVLELQGFIFFGTANVILERARQRQAAVDEKPLLFLILDFRRVTGLDSSAAFSLTKVKFMAETHQFTLLFTHLNEEIRAELARSELSDGEFIRIFDDLDHALEWCEDSLLERSQVTQSHIPTTLALQLADSGFKRELTTQLKLYLQPMRLQPGDYLIRQGESSGDLFFIEMGQVSIYLELGDNERIRRQTLGMGTVVGELSFFLHAERSASVIADEITTAYRLTQQAMDEMKAKDKELAIAFNEMMLRLVSERLIASNRELAALSR